MAIKLLYNEDALVDLEEVFDWSREKYPERTEQFGDELFNSLGLAGGVSSSWHFRKKELNVRRLLHAPFCLYYRFDEDRGVIEILHFWHTSRRSPKL